jgi:putative ABC transport system ATP-binding protein
MDKVGQAIVRAHEVYKSYPVGDDEIPVLKGVSFDIQAGHFVAIVGPSGNGKSTLLNMITGIDHPTSGQVTVTGNALHNMNENQLAAWRSQHMGIVFQFFQLIPSLNLLQNIVMPMDFAGKLGRPERRERALHLLDLVGLADQAQKLPGNISGGQQQRAAIARAMANDPPLIVADEPTGNLDNQTSEEVFNLFSHLVDQGKTLIMVTHNLELAQRVPRRIEIENGRIVRDVRQDFISKPTHPANQAELLPV